MGLLDAAAGAITGGTNQKLEKLSVSVERDDNHDLANAFKNVHPIEVMFNPTTILQTLKANWTKETNKETRTEWINGFSGCSLDTLSIDLYFDTTEPVGDAGSSSGVVDVRRYSSVIVDLTRNLPSKHRPPLCRLTWGNTDSSGNPLFTGVMTQVTQTFTYFHRNGTPLRAKLGCSLTQFTEQTKELHSSDVFKSYMVRRGDTMASIATEMLHESTLWRLIAIANGITDPLDLEPGRILRIPVVGRS